MRALLSVILVVVLGGACGCGIGGSSEPEAVRFTAVTLPGGAVPVALSPAGDALLVGVRREGQPVVPGLLRLGGDGAATELAVNADTPYGLLATWQSIASDGDHVLAVGGERGGAHGNVRWSVWTGSVGGGLTEQRQAFSTFGGYGAGDLIDAVLTPAGGLLVGTWESAQVGFDVAVWTSDGATWTRQSSAGTALENSKSALSFPLAATSLGEGVLVAGSQLALDAGRQIPVVWRSAAGNTGWTGTVLPDGGQIAAAAAARCLSTTVCAAAGRVDGKLAVWRLADGVWTRLPGVPPVPVGDRDKLPAPVDAGGHLVELVSDGGQVKIARADGDRWALRATAGPTGRATVVTTVGTTLYVLAGADESSQTLWRADLASIR